MQVTSPSILSSLTREAGRQHDYFALRRDGDLAEFWAELESMAFRARSERMALVITMESVNMDPHIIKACEQLQ